MLKKLSLRNLLSVAFLFMSAIILMVALVGWGSNYRLSKQIAFIGDDAFPSTVALWKVNEGQTQVQSSERALLNPALPFDLRRRESERISRAWQQINEGLSEYEQLPRDADEEKLYQAFKPLWDEWVTAHQTFMNLTKEFAKYNLVNPQAIQIELLNQNRRNTPELETARAASAVLERMNEETFNQNRSAFQAATDALLNLLDYNAKTAEAARQKAAKDVSETKSWVFLGFLIGPLTAVLFGWFFNNMITNPLGSKIAGVVNIAEKMSRGDLTSQVPVEEKQDEIGKLLVAFRGMSQGLNGLIRQVQHSGIQITTSATQIAASGKQLEATVNEQVASINEVVATAKEIAATSGQLVKTMDDVSHLSETTAEVAGEGQKELYRMETTMRQLADATSSISSRLGVISEKANNINSIVTTITKVADQTNLLSLNAAIEAEKAGEYGVGFAVVAREIRRLADQTAVATLDIESMVKEMQSAVSTGVMEMDKFTKEVGRGVEDIRTISAQLAEIIDRVQSLTPRFESVNQGMGAQSEGAQQISQAMVQLSEASAQTADALREINGAIGQLNEASQGLRQEISKFKVSTHS